MQVEIDQRAVGAMSRDERLRHYVAPGEATGCRQWMPLWTHQHDRQLHQEDGLYLQDDRPLRLYSQVGFTTGNLSLDFLH